MIIVEKCGVKDTVLTKGMLQEIPEDNMFLHTREWYREKDIEITTGVKAAIPEIEDIGLNGVFHIRSAEETESMRRYIESYDIRDILIIGGGIQ